MTLQDVKSARNLVLSPLAWPSKYDIVLGHLNYSKSKVSTFKFPANSKLRKQKEFQPEKNSRICAVHFTEDYFR